MLEIIELITSIVIVFLASMLFVNAIEYAGFLLRLGTSFIGAILSPLFTSLPEMIVFLVAVFVAKAESVGIGTIFGQPFMASSLSYGLVGVAVVLGYKARKRKSTELKVDRSLVIPFAFVTILFPLTLLPDFVGYHKLFGILFLASYIVYVVLMMRGGEETLDEPNDLYLCRNYPKIGISVQLICAIILLYIGSDWLVESVKKIAMMLGISELGLALIIVPMATAIPETASAIIWGYRGRDTMSIGSLVGEKILYSTFYPGLGLLTTSWKLDDHAFMSVFATTIISIVMLKFISKERIPAKALFLGIVFFIGYIVAVFLFHT